MRECDVGLLFFFFGLFVYRMNLLRSELVFAAFSLFTALDVLRTGRHEWPGLAFPVHSLGAGQL